jgi:hypothetical protein
MNSLCNLPEVLAITGMKAVDIGIVKASVKDKNYIWYVYYESLKREIKTKTIYGCRCDERLKTNVEESTRLACTRGIYTSRMHSMRFFVYYESLNRELKTKTAYGYRCDERLKTNVKESTRLGCTPLYAELEHLKIETRLTSETPVSEMGEYASVML